jgi:hypothetical protein
MILSDPSINEGVRAYIDIPLTDTSGVLRIAAVAPGVAGNNYTVRCLTGEAQSLDVSWSTPNLVITLPEDSAETAYSLVRHIARYHSEIFTELTFTYDDADADKVVRELELSNLANGEDVYNMTATGQQIDAVVAQYAKYTLDGTAPPGVDIDEAAGYRVGSIWIDVNEAKTYICLDATEGNAIWEEVGKATTASDAPTMAVAASGSIELDTGISLDFTAKTKGIAGNSIVVNLIDPEAENATIGIVVDGSEINITLASSAVPAITSTAANVKTAIESDTGANALVSVAITGETSTLALEGTETLEGGIDGTPAPLGKIIMDATGGKIWIAFAECTASNTDGWRSITVD